MKQIKNYLPSVLLIFILAQTLPYKFSGSEQTQHIFSTVGEYMGSFFGLTESARGFAGIGIGKLFSGVGGYLIGSVELVAVIFLLLGFKYKRLRFYGSILAGIVLTGAVFFHLFSPLGINVAGDGGYLFTLAVIGFISAFYISWTEYDSCKID